MDDKWYRGTEMEPSGEHLLASEIFELVKAGVNFVEKLPVVSID